MTPTHRYLIEIQYLGFRYHGWMKQPKVRTLESMVEKTLAFVLGHGDFRILGAGRTDAMVSALHYAFALHVETPLAPDFLDSFNANLPPDIRALDMGPVDGEFNILQSPRLKEYVYLFGFGEKPHPFSAPFMACFPGQLDVDAMASGARLFEGRHHFGRYCTKPGPDTVLERDIQLCRIRENTELTASFFPGESWALHVHGQGFLRYQIRLIMGQLLRLGRGEIDLDEIRNSLTGNEIRPLNTIAPASGLMLRKIRFKVNSQV
ncbi:MAG: tRNA pseudouridine(38-40) synthase TruA [Desulfobacterales bacterium]|nr:tRNA pseudouridine(38-40) synthase TruA [Desulfobacterales bacterium]